MLPPRGLSGLDSVNDVASLTQRTLPKLTWVVANRVSLYDRFSRPKKKGGERIITPPKGELRAIQYRIKGYLDRRIVWPEHLHGGIKERSVLSNALFHVGCKTVANFDVKNFFPSTSEERVAFVLENGGMDKSAAQLVAALCCLDGHLPQGSPTSTCLANLAFLPTDEVLLRLAKRHRLFYTRFVDDITLSGDKDLRPLKGVIAQIIVAGGYGISLQKVIGRDEPQIVTGLVVNDKIRPTTEFLFTLKRDIRDCWSNQLGPRVVAASYGLTERELRNRLWGKLTFIRQFRRKLYQKVRALMEPIIWSDRARAVQREPSMVYA